MPSWFRARASFIALALGTIAVGLVVHTSGKALGPTARDVLGDALWAMMIAWWIAALVPAGALRVRSGAALAICVAVEVSQLVHTSTLDALRGTAAGQLILGSGFDPRDLAAYAIGVLAAASLESMVRPRRASQ